MCKLINIIFLFAGFILFSQVASAVTYEPGYEPKWVANIFKQVSDFSDPSSTTLPKTLTNPSCDVVGDTRDLPPKLHFIYNTTDKARSAGLQNLANCLFWALYERGYYYYSQTWSTNIFNDDYYPEDWIPFKAYGLDPEDRGAMFISPVDAMLNNCWTSWVQRHDTERAARWDKYQVWERKSNGYRRVEKCNRTHVYDLYKCISDGWSCGGWGPCSANDVQTRTCNLTYNCPGVDNPSPPTSRTCTPIKLTIVKSGSGTVTSKDAKIDCGTTCSAPYDLNASVRIRMSPDPGWSFDWKTLWWQYGGPCESYPTTDLNECEFKMNADKTIYVNFTKIPEPLELKVSILGTGTGIVTGPGINCGTDCAEPYAQNTLVILTATPSPDSELANWSGACAGTGNCTVTMSENKFVIANFNKKPTLFKKLPKFIREILPF
jgi:hypothetical protein